MVGRLMTFKLHSLGLFQKISLSSPFQRLILFLTLASATLSQFAFVILLPILCRSHHESLKSHEIGMLIVALTAGELLAYRYTEPCISNFGIRWSLQLGFLFQISTGYAFWYVSFIQSDFDFLVYAFFSRLLHGVGGGLMKSVCLLAHASGEYYKEDLPEDHFRWILQGESLGYLLGPFLVTFITTAEQMRSREIFLYLAIATTAVWVIFSISFREQQPQSRPRRQRQGAERLDTASYQPLDSKRLSRQRGFIKSILYNTVPLTAFINRRTVLASSTIIVGYIQISFVMPFFSLMSGRPSYQVSLQVFGALLVFAFATLVSVHAMKFFGPKVITWFALSLNVAGCVLIGIHAKNVRPDAELKDTEKPWFENPIESLLFYYDGAIAGYLLICITAAFLSTASFREVMAGTEATLKRTKFKDNTGIELFCEVGFIVQSLVTVGFIFGPVIGGYLNDSVGIHKTCISMALFAAGYLALYTVFATFVHCTTPPEMVVNLNESSDLNRSRDGDQLSKLLRILDKTDRNAARRRRAEEDIETLDDMSHCEEESNISEIPA